MANTTIDYNKTAITTLTDFKSQLKTHLFTEYYMNV